MKTPQLGERAGGGAVSIDVERLIVSRMLLCANSGGGKSWALRRLLEQTHGAVQQLVIDPEGEFFTLRERFDYVLAGKGGDCPAEPRSAALLARRLLELGTSAIVDLYELAPRDRVLFVRRFLEALIDAPRELWHPALVVLDEAHTFAPEKGHGDAESGEAVARLMAQGRKRGFAGVLATQRISKLAKDVAAEANNVLIGRAVLDVDQKRAAAALGIASWDAAQKLRSLKSGHFYAFGPALSADVVEIHVGDVTTSHPKAGQRAAPPPPPRERVRKLLGQLADLPKEAEAELRTIAESKARVVQLERELAAARKAQPEAKVVEVPVLSGKELATLRELIQRCDGIAHDFQPAAAEFGKRLADTAHELRTRILEALRVPDRAPAPKLEFKPTGMSVIARSEPPRQPRADAHQSNGETISGPERKLLTALVQHGRMSKVKLALLTNYSHQGGAFRNPLGALRSRGLVEYAGDQVQVTQAGIDALGACDPLPTGTALLEQWLGQLGGPESKLLRCLAEVYPKALDVEELARRAGYEASGGAFRNPLGRLRTLELVSRGREVRASEVLFS